MALKRCKRNLYGKAPCCAIFSSKKRGHQRLFYINFKIFLLEIVFCFCRIVLLSISWSIQILPWKLPFKKKEVIFWTTNFVTIFMSYIFFFKVCNEEMKESFMTGINDVVVKHNVYLFYNVIKSIHCHSWIMSSVGWWWARWCVCVIGAKIVVHITELTDI